MAKGLRRLLAFNVLPHEHVSIKRPHGLFGLSIKPSVHRDFRGIQETGSLCGFSNSTRWFRRLSVLLRMAIAHKSKTPCKEKDEVCFGAKQLETDRILAVPGPRKQFARNLSRLRAAAELTQEALAEKAEVSVRYVQFIEAGRYIPTVAVAGRIRKALACSWDELCAGL